jgi:hypothetical protein
VETKNGVSVTITGGETTTVNVSLEPIIGPGAKGKFQYELVLPAGVSSADLALVSVPTAQGTDPAAINLLTTAGVNTFENDVAFGTIADIPAGYYTLTVLLAGSANGGVAKIVHIYQGWSPRIPITSTHPVLPMPPGSRW